MSWGDWRQMNGRMLLQVQREGGHQEATWDNRVLRGASLLNLGGELSLTALPMRSMGEMASGFRN